MATRPYGLHPLAWELYLESGLDPSRIGQTIGAAAASAGTHKKTGEYEGHDYGACFDLHVHDLTHHQVIDLVVTPLALQGFVAYMRIPGVDHWPAGEVYHVHCVYPNCNMVASVAHQVEDWLNQEVTLNGLASHVRYHAYQATHEWRAACRPLFEGHVVVP